MNKNKNSTASRCSLSIGMYLAAKKLRKWQFRPNPPHDRNEDTGGKWEGLAQELIAMARSFLESPKRLDHLAYLARHQKLYPRPLFPLQDDEVSSFGKLTFWKFHFGMGLW